MKIKLNKKYKSLVPFELDGIPDFMVISGVNASGKTQLLQGVHGEVVNSCDENGDSFASKRFIPINSLVPNDQSRVKHKITKEHHQYYIGMYNNYLKSKKSNPKVKVKDFFGENTHLLKRIAENVKKGIDDLNNNDFYNFSALGENKIDIFHQNFSNIFKNYQVRKFNNSFNEFKNQKFEKNYGYLSDDEFVKINGAEPWILINDILKAANLDYSLNHPSIDDDVDVFFHLVLTNTVNGAKISFSDLSTGEKVIMSLAFAVYNASFSKKSTDILLMDEPDAPLHPSMIKQFLEVIKKVLVEGMGIKVIITTHSPTTVALSSEESLYVMSKGGETMIEKSSKENALEILTEGFASLSVGESSLGISYNISKSNLPVLFTEGITDKIILETAWEKLNPGKTIPFYIQDSFDASFLGNLFRRGDDAQEGIFEVYSDKKMIALFDFDFAGYNQWKGLKKFSNNLEIDPTKCLTKKHANRKAYAMLLPVPDSDIKSQVIKDDSNTFEDKSILDIELLFYGVTSLNSFFKKEQQAGGGEIVKFSGEKKKFAKKVNELSIDDFKNFKAIFDKIKSLDKK